MPTKNRMLTATPSRRDLLFAAGTAMGLGPIALASVLDPKPPHHAAKAKRCIILHSSQPSVSTRPLSDLALSLLNSNEFVYAY